MDKVLDYLLPILATELAGIISYIALKAKKMIEKYFDDKTKRDDAVVCVLAVEQCEKKLKGQKKFDRCAEELKSMLKCKGIQITELETKMLIEAAVLQLNAKKEGAKK